MSTQILSSWLERWNDFSIDLCNLANQQLRACPPEDQAGVIHAIAPISVKLGQIEGHTQ